MKIHWISPYRTDKNIGLAINDAIIQLRPAEDDWIVHVDQDVMFLLPDTKAQIINILGDTKYDILGCMTNRLGLRHQRLPGYENDSDIMHHVGAARAAQMALGDKILNAEDNIVAAMVMCFRHSTWKMVGGFYENRINFDSLFCYYAHKEGAKIGIMLGVYVFHLYRWGSADPQNDIKHLQV